MSWMLETPPTSGFSLGSTKFLDALHCTALLPVVDTRPRTIQSLALLVFGVLCFLVTTVCLVSGETSSTLSARDESTANYDEAVELVHKNIK